VTRFTRFAAVDWSGAKGARHKGIAIAVAEAGQGAPRLLRRAKPWSRSEVLAWVERSAGGTQPTLIGFDFSFAPPIHERGAYLPGEALAVEAKPFWAYVDRVCDDEDLGAASFLEATHRPHFYFGAADGPKAAFLHHRRCEHAFNATGGGKASTLYDAIGAAQVAKASFAGMRLLHRVEGRVAIWPFDPLPGSGGAIVEIYTRVFIRMAGLNGRKVRTRHGLNAALAALGSRPARLRDEPSDHETDVMIAAAGMRAIADDARTWHPAGLTPALAVTEGWTFGVR